MRCIVSCSPLHGEYAIVIVHIFNFTFYLHIWFSVTLCWVYDKLGFKLGEQDRGVEAEPTGPLHREVFGALNSVASASKRLLKQKGIFKSVWGHFGVSGNDKSVLRDPREFVIVPGDMSGDIKTFAWGQSHTCRSPLEQIYLSIRCLFMFTIIIVICKSFENLFVETKISIKQIS